METYLIIFAIVFSITVISGIINAITKKKDTESVTAEVSEFLFDGFSIASVFMFFWGLYCIFC